MIEAGMSLSSGWIKFYGIKRMFRWTRTVPLFSERYGYRKPFLKIGHLRLFWGPFESPYDEYLNKRWSYHFDPSERFPNPVWFDEAMGRGKGDGFKRALDSMVDRGVLNGMSLSGGGTGCFQWQS